MPELVKFIDNQTELDSAAEKLAHSRVIAADLEADSMYHFSEKICLMQLASDSEIYIVDPLAAADMTRIQGIMQDPAIKKVFHGADYDVRCLVREYGIRIKNLFDTEIAGRFLGCPETGLDSMVQKIFNVELKKKYQKKDWSQRPLPADMIDYAAGDVKYLIDLSSIMEKRLSEKGRLYWVKEECRRLSEVRPEPADSRPLFTRCRGAGQLEPRSLAVLESLLEMRRKKAREKDRPPFKIIGSSALLQLARARPGTLKKLRSINILSSRQISMYGRDILEAIKRAEALPDDRLPQYPRRTRPRHSAGQAEKVRRLKSWRKTESRRLSIDPGVLLSNAQIASIVEKNPEEISELKSVDGIRDWQAGEYGKKLLNLINQEKKI